MMDDINDVLKAVKGVNDIIAEDHAQISEQEFVSKFLPYLMSKEEVDLRPWIAIAGNANRCVDVVRGTTVIYTVPPLLNSRGVTNTNRRPQDDLGHQMQEGYKEGLNVPAKANIILHDKLAKFISSPLLDEKGTMMWTKVLKENGIDISDFTAVTNPVETEEPSSFLEEGEDV